MAGEPLRYYSELSSLYIYRQMGSIFYMRRISIEISVRLSQQKVLRITLKDFGIN